MFYGSMTLEQLIGQERAALALLVRSDGTRSKDMLYALKVIRKCMKNNYGYNWIAKAVTREIA